MNIETFITQRQERWRELDSALDGAERSGEHVTLGEVQRIIRLYRQACSDLNQARSLTANPDLLRRLNDVTGRGYRFVYRGGRTERLRDIAKRLFSIEIPATFRRERRVVLSALAAMVAGVVIGGLAVSLDTDNARRIVPAQFYTDDIRDRVTRIETGDERIDSLDHAAAFGAFLYTHNIRVALLGFSLGAVTIIGAYWLLFYNGAIFGAIAASYVAAGSAVFFVAWVGPHGALELPAIIFGTAAGIRLGEAFWLPGSLSRAEAVRQTFIPVWRMLIATACWLILAGIIEGSFSQFSSQTFPAALKISVAVLLLGGTIAYLFVWRSAGDDS